MRRLLAVVLVTMLLLAGCTQPPVETPMPGPDEAPAPATETPAPTEMPETQPTEPTSEPELLKVVGQIGGPTQAVAVQGDYAYVGVGLRLIVLNATDPTNPMEVGATEPFGWYVEDVALVGNTAFVVAGSAGLYIIDVSEPACPAVIGNVDTPGFAESMVVAGDYAYVADGPAGLRVVDIRDLAHPAEVGHAYTQNYAFDVVVEGRYAYIAAAGAGLLVADISDPAKPREIGALDTPGYAYGVAVSRGTAYVADGWGGLRVVDVSRPSELMEVGFFDTAGWALEVVFGGEKAYVADHLSGVVVDVSDRTQPRQLADLHSTIGQPTGGWRAITLALGQDLVYVADRSGGIRVIDVSDLAKPAVIGLYNPLGFAGSVAVAGRYVFLAGVNGLTMADLQIVDVSNPALPLRAAADVPGLGSMGVTVAGNFAYVLAGRELHILDISDPLQPIAISSQGLEGPPWKVLIKEQTAYVTTEFSFEIVDVSDPFSPSRLGVLDFMGGLGRAGGAGAAMDVGVSGNTAYVTTDWHGLVVVDVSNLAEPTVVAYYDPYDFGMKPLSVIVSGDHAYLGNGGCLSVIDISSTERPQPVSELRLPGEDARLALADGMIYAASGSAGLVAIDVSDPQRPVLVGSRQLPGHAVGVAVDADYVYVATGEGGLYILERLSSGKAAVGPASSTHNQAPEFISGNSALLVSAATGEPLSIPPHHWTQTHESWPASHDSGHWANLVPSVADPAPTVLPGSGQIWVVSSAADSGPGTLRWALESARSGDTITFDPEVFPPTRPATISPTSGLPYLSQGRLTIDASDAGVVLDGSDTPEGTHGLVIDSDYNIVKGLQITGFPGAGVGIGGGAYNTIGGDRGRGSSPSGEGNVISGNKYVGVGIADCPASVASDLSGEPCEEGRARGNRIVGNYIGPDAAGTEALGRQGTGVFVGGSSSNNTIGGTNPADRNIISGNVRAGVSLTSTSHHNIVAGNYIGTDASGLRALGNEVMGLSIESGHNNRVVGNVISGNDQGVVIADAGASGNEIIGNLIGTDATGTAALGNGYGVGAGPAFNKIGGTTPEERNVISGNLNRGISIGGTIGAVVIGNFIGTDVTGTRPLGNGSDGIWYLGSTYHNFIGGTTAGERNIISGNAGSGIMFEGTGVRTNFVTGNYIGTDVTGTAALPNQAGVAVEGVHNFVQQNLIAYNRKCGAMVNDGEGHTVIHNSFIENGSNGYDGGQGTRWDDGDRGNYWSDYQGTNANGDGIGDTPYSVPPNGMDSYPLMKPYSK